MPTEPTWEETEAVPSWDETDPVKLSLAEPRQPGGPSTTAGGPRAPLASYRETMAEVPGPFEPISGPLPQMAPVGPGPTGYPAHPIEKALARLTPGGNVLSMVNPDLAAQFNRTLANQAIGLVDFMRSPGGAAVSAIAPVAPTLVSLGFTADMAKSLYEQAKQTIPNWERMSDTERLDAVMNMAATVGMAGLAGKHAFTGIRNKVAPPVPVPPRIPTPPRPEVFGERLNMPPGAPAPMQEAPRIERLTPEQARAQAEAMTQRATAAVEEAKPTERTPDDTQGEGRVAGGKPPVTEELRDVPQQESGTAPTPTDQAIQVVKQAQIGDSVTVTLHHGGKMEVASASDASVPQDVLGTFWSPERETSAAHGPVTTETVTLSKVFPVLANDMPRTVEEALKWREDLIADGYDAIIINSAGIGDTPEVIRLSIPERKPVAPDQAVPQKVEAKEPWQMTQQQWQDARHVLRRTLEATADQSVRTFLESELAKFAREHSEQIAIAAREGKPVPPEVLAEYHDLAKPTPTPAPVQAKPGEGKVEPWEKQQRQYEAQGMSATPEAAPIRKQIEALESEIKEVRKAIPAKYVDTSSMAPAERNIYASGNLSKLRKDLSVRKSTLGAAILSGKNRPFEWASRDKDPAVRAAAIKHKELSDRRQALVRQIDALKEHRAWVEYALKEGKQVPPEVLAEYPDLSKAPPPAPPAAATAKAQEQVSVKGLSKAESSQLKTLTNKVESGAKLTADETRRYQELRDKATGGKPEEQAGVTAGPQGAISVNVQQLTPAAAAPPVVPVKPLSQIIRDLSKGLNIPIRFGRLINRYGGYFMPIRNYIASRKPNQIPVVSHEVGHKLDDLFKFSADPAIRAEIETLGDNATPGSMSSWTKSKNLTYKRGEGVAEFTRYWLTNPAHAQQVAPTLYPLFERILDANPDFGAVMRQARNDIQLWRTSPGEARLASSISTGNPIPAKYGFTDLMRDVVDDLHYVRQAVEHAKSEGATISAAKDPYKLARLLRGSYGMASTFIRRGIVDFRTKEVQMGTGLQDALAPVAGRIDGFRNWIIAKRAAELQAQGRETGLLSQDVAEVLRKYDQAPGFQEAFNKVKAWNDALLQYAVDAGMISPEGASAMRKMNQDYVPFHRLMEVGAGEVPAEAGAGTGRGLNVGKPGSLKGLHGSTRDIIDPLESMIKNAYSVITAAEKNYISVALADLAKMKDMGRWVERVGTPKEMVKVQLEKIREQLEQAGADVTNLPDDLLLTFYRQSKRAPYGENTIIVNRSGNLEFYRLNKDLFDTFHALDMEASGWLIRMLSTPAQMLRAGVTLTPDFAVANALRDTVSSAIVSRYTVFPFYNTLRGVAALMGDPKLVAEWAASGGRHAIEVSYFDRAKVKQFLSEKITKDLTPKEQALVYLKSPLTALRLLTGTFEEATRIGEYKLVFDKLRQQGVPEGDARRLAAYESRDYQDFAKGGSKTKPLRGLVAFWNAQLQGNVRLAQAFRERPGSTLLKGLAWITIPKLLEQAANWEDPDYWDRPQWERDLFFLIPFGKDENNRTQFLRIPTPFEAGIIFGTLPGRFLQHMKDNDSAASRDLFNLIRKTAVPNPIPQAVLTVLEVVAGKQGYSLWRGRPIVPESLKDAAPELQFTEQQSLTAKRAGEILGISPAKIDYLIQGLTGGLGKQIVHKGIDPMIAAVTGEKRTATRTGPLARFVTTPAGTQSEAVERFYLALNKAREDASRQKAGKATKGHEADAEMLERVARELSDLRKQAREAINPVIRQRHQLEIARKAKEALTQRQKR